MPAEVSNRGVLQQLAPVRAALPAGSGSLPAGDFAALSTPAFDPGWVSGLINRMVHSIELLFDCIISRGGGAMVHSIELLFDEPSEPHCGG